MYLRRIISSITILILTLNVCVAQSILFDITYSFPDGFVYYDGQAVLKDDNNVQMFTVGLHGIKRDNISSPVINTRAQFFLRQPDGTKYALSEELQINNADFDKSLMSRIRYANLSFRGSSKVGDVLLIYYDIKPDGSKTNSTESKTVYKTVISAARPNEILQPTAWNKFFTGHHVLIKNSELENYRRIKPSMTHYFANSGTNPTMFSGGRQVSMTLQGDGNLVIKQVSTNKVLWASNSNQQQGGGVYAAIFQTDGNIVIYKRDNNGKFTIPIWESGTTVTGQSRAEYIEYSFLALQDDGNFVLYHPRYNTIDFYNVILKTNSENHQVSNHFGKMK